VNGYEKSEQVSALFCGHCGTAIPNNSKFCPNCGKKRTDAPQPKATSVSTKFPVRGYAIICGLSFLSIVVIVIAVALIRSMLPETPKDNSPPQIGNAPPHIDNAQVVQEKQSESESSNNKTDNFLGKYGNDVIAWDKNGIMLLHKAVTLEKLEVIKYLISEGADVNAKSNQGTTPLHFAVAVGNIDIIKYLVSEGADVNEKDNDGDTPLDVAKSKRNTAIVQYLISIGAKE
jgi:hypothetical protein